MNRDEIHIGRLIHNKLKEDGRSASWLAKKIHCERTAIYKIFKRPSIDTDLLLKINSVLKAVFFDYYAEISRNMEDKTD